MQLKNKLIFSNNISPTRKIAISGLVIALYVTIMYFTQSFAFGSYQIRIATSLYSLAAIYPFLIIPLGLCNLISNMLMGSMGIFDVLGGFIVGIITSSLVYLIKRMKLNDMLIALPIIFVPGLIVPIWLSKILSLPYSMLTISLCVGQIVPGIVGVFIVKQMKNKLN